MRGGFGLRPEDQAYFLFQSWNSKLEKVAHDFIIYHGRQMDFREVLLRAMVEHLHELYQREIIWVSSTRDLSRAAEAMELRTELEEDAISVNIERVFVVLGLPPIREMRTFITLRRGHVYTRRPSSLEKPPAPRPTGRFVDISDPSSTQGEDEEHS